jgi:spore germination protein YaaH
MLTAILLASAIVATAPAGAQPRALFYMTRDPGSVRSFLAHADKVDILVPTWYSVDANGLVSGGPNPLVMDTARQHHVPVMPIVASSGFILDEFHKLLLAPDAQRVMVASLIRACRENGYTGIQFDFEDIIWTDRDALSTMVAEAARQFHAAGLQLSIATVPNAPGAPGAGGFSAWIFEYWRGAYDLQALAKSVDLICLMTYDQHTRWTAPGPVAGWEWTTQNLDYALKVVPPEKLSLGIPLYGYHWFAGSPIKSTDKTSDKPNPSAEYISTNDALDLARAYGGKVQWDPVDHVSWFYFYRDQMREWIFFTDSHTFSDRYALVKQHNLQGFCSWVLGNEDNGIWDALPAHP